MWRLIDFSPFFALGIAERFGLGAAGRFYVAALVAAAAGLASVVWGRRVNPLITGALLWFIFVAAAYLAGIGAVGRLEEPLLFAFVLAVGCCETFANPRGFVDAVHADRAAVRRLSLPLIVATIAAFALSYLLRGDIALAGVLPYALLFLAQAWLRRKLASIPASTGQSSPS
jgi:hypothetical protein